MDQFSEETLPGPIPELGSRADFNEINDTEDIDVPFTPAARQVIDRCVDSLADGDEQALTGCLLRAISETPRSAAAQLIEEHGESGEHLLTALQALLGCESRCGEQPASPRLERVVIRAKREAYRRQHTEVSTLHLLMALLRERSSSPMQVVH